MPPVTTAAVAGGSTFATKLMAILGVAEFGATLWAGSKQAEETRKINRESLEFAKEQQEYERGERKKAHQIATETLAMQKRGQRFQEREAELNREERQEDRGYNRLQNAANKYAEYLNTKTALTSARLNPIMSRGRR